MGRAHFVCPCWGSVHLDLLTWLAVAVFWWGPRQNLYVEEPHLETTKRTIHTVCYTPPHLVAPMLWKDLAFLAESPNQAMLHFLSFSAICFGRFPYCICFSAIRRVRVGALFRAANTQRLTIARVFSFPFIGGLGFGTPLRFEAKWGKGANVQPAR